MRVLNSYNCIPIIALPCWTTGWLCKKIHICELDSGQVWSSTQLSLICYCFLFNRFLAQSVLSLIGGFMKGSWMICTMRSVLPIVLIRNNQKAHSCSSFIKLILICKYLRILDHIIFVSTNSQSWVINVPLNTFVVINNYLLAIIVNEK